MADLAEATKKKNAEKDKEGNGNEEEGGEVEESLEEALEPIK